MTAEYLFFLPAVPDTPYRPHQSFSRILDVYSSPRRFHIPQFSLTHLRLSVESSRSCTVDCREVHLLRCPPLRAKDSCSLAYRTVLPSFCQRFFQCQSSKLKKCTPRPNFAAYRSSLVSPEGGILSCERPPAFFS